MSEAAAEYIAAIDAQRFANYVAVSSAVLVVYNHLITLADEVHYFRRERRICPSLLYLSNRYIILASIVLDDFSFWSVSQYSKTACLAGTIIDGILDVAQYIPPAAFSGLRTRALAKRRDCALLVFFLSLSPLLINAINMWRWETVSVDPSRGCLISDDVPQGIYEIFTFTARVPLIIAEITVLVVTWVTQFRAHRLASTARVGRRMSLFFILLRDGSVYFLIITALSLLRISLSVVAIYAPNVNAAADATGTFLSYFINPITAILLDRFLSDLHQAADSGTGSSLSSGGSLSIGPIGLAYMGSIASELPAPMEANRAAGVDSEEHREEAPSHATNA